MRIPESVRGGLRKRLWAIADRLDWSRLSWLDKTKMYKTWTKDPAVGGLLSNYMDERQIRVYIKDTIMKGYVRARLEDPRPVMRSLGLLAENGQPEELGVAEHFERPHGFRLVDGRIVVWSSAKDWKIVLMVTHERAFSSVDYSPYAAVLFSATGQFSEESFRKMVQDGATKLGIERLIWLA
jgi:hypothetical protein